MCSKHVEEYTKLIVKQKFCTSSWLITEINILRCAANKTSKFSLIVWVFWRSEPRATWYVSYCETNNRHEVAENRLLRVITQRAVVIYYRRFGTTYQVPSSGAQEFLNPRGWDRQVFPKRREQTTTTGCVITQKSTVVDKQFEFWNVPSPLCV